jgi:hypothetical protein
MKSKKKNPDKNIKYTVAEIKEMILRDSPLIEYGRYNITAPKIVMERLAQETDEPRSSVVTRYVLEDLEERELDKKRNALARDLAFFNKEAVEIVNSYDHSHIP